MIEMTAEWRAELRRRDEQHRTEEAAREAKLRDMLRAELREKYPRTFLTAFDAHTDEGDLPEGVRTWLDSALGNTGHGGLLLAGNVGVGKTWLAHRTVRLLAEAKDWAVRLTSVTEADLLGALRPRHDVDAESEYRRYARSGLLLVDDLGTSPRTEWSEATLGRLIDERYRNARLTILTTNLTRRDLAARLGERTVSRLGEMCIRVTITGTDRRRSTR